MEVLDEILGSLAESDHFHAENTRIDDLRLNDFVSDIDFGGLSLEDFAASPRKLPRDARHVLDSTSVEDYEKEKDRFQDLHTSILACDGVLESVEGYLTSFRTDLASVSTEIETLQNRSTALNNKVQNRRAVEKCLGPEVEALCISSAVVRKITEGTIDDNWIKALDELERRMKTVDAKLREGKDVKALQEARVFFDEVSTKAVERIRDYVVAQIKALRSPGVNAQVVQQNSFLRYKDVFAFLAKRQPQLSDEISQAYVNTMRWYYSSHFARYRAALEKLSLHIIDQNDVIALDGATKKVARSGAGHDIFSIGRRMDVLRASHQAALPSFAAENDKAAHYLEVPFSAFNLAVIENASAEFSFLTDFFSKQPFQTTIRKFNEIFRPTFELGQSFTKELIEHTLDAFGVLICVRLNQHFAFQLQRRKVPAVDSYINGTSMLLWPRFQKIIDAHCESIRKTTNALPGKPAGSALTLASSPSTAQTTAPHPLAQRYAKFLQGMLALSSEAGDDEPISNSVGRLRDEFKGFLAKLSKGFAEARKRERFVHNNCSLICTVIADTEGKLAGELKAHHMEQRDAIGLDD